MPRTSRRFAVALAVSAAVHAVFAASLALETRRRDAPFSPAAAPITVRLGLASVAEAVAGSPMLDAERPPATPQVEPRAPVRRNDQRPATVMPDAKPAQHAAAALALPQVPDPTYYSTRELDSYPRPVTPLRLGHPAGVARDGVPERVQLSLHIDEHGVVNRISIVETALPGDFEDELRAMLTATRFIPARKDGRPVKSRILLSISFAAAGENEVQP